MRYDNFYPFQQQAAFRQLPMTPNNFLPAHGMQALSAFRQLPFPRQTPLPTNATSKLDSFLHTADKLFSTAQNYTPYIQQAVPMVKNLPALYRMYKGFQGLPDVNKTNNKQTKAPRRAASPSNRRQNLPEQSDLTPKPSKPRIFQPPFE